jgi:hypothetical protein
VDREEEEGADGVVREEGVEEGQGEALVLGQALPVRVGLCVASAGEGVGMEVGVPPPPLVEVVDRERVAVKRGEGDCVPVAGPVAAGERVAVRDG